MSLECEHGQLARSCYICELEAEVERLLENIKHEIDVDQARIEVELENQELRKEVERLKEELDNENKFYENYEKTSACDNSLARAVIGAKRDARPLHECMEEWANHFLDENNTLYDKLSRYESGVEVEGYISAVGILKPDEWDVVVERFRCQRVKVLVMKEE